MVDIHPNCLNVMRDVIVNMNDTFQKHYKSFCKPFASAFG